MYNISTKSNIRAAHPTNCPDYKIKLQAAQQLHGLQICDTVTTKSTYSAFPPSSSTLLFFFSQPETPDSSDQIVLSVISNHEPVRAAAAEVEPVLLFPHQLNGSGRNFTANLTGTRLQYVRGQYFTGNPTFTNLIAPTLMQES